MGEFAAGRQGDRGAVERAMFRLERRYGPRWTGICVAGGLVLSALTMLVGVVIYSRYMRLSGGEVVGLGIAASLLTVAGCAVALFTMRKGLREVIAWHGPGRSPEGAPRVWKAALDNITQVLGSVPVIG